MSTVKIGFRDLSIPDRIQRARNIVAAMDGNEHFPSPIPTLDRMLEIIQDMENTYQDALDGGKKWKAIRKLAQKELMKAINSLGGYVQAASGGDQVIILSSGFDTRRTSTTRKHVDVPRVPVIKAGHLPGEIRVSWGRVPRARSYALLISHDNGETWENAGEFTKSRIVLSGLKPGSHPMLKVAAFGSLGYSAWTEPGSGKAPW